MRTVLFHDARSGMLLLLAVYVLVFMVFDVEITQLLRTNEGGMARIITLLRGLAIASE